MKKTLWDLAWKDYELSVLILNQDDDDSLTVNAAGYHLQQAVEKGLKFSLSCRGLKFPHTHSIEVLLDTMDESNIVFPDWIKENSSFLSQLESKTRYDVDFCTSKTKLVEILNLCEIFLENLKPPAGSKSNFLGSNLLNKF